MAQGRQTRGKQARDKQARDKQARDKQARGAAGFRVFVGLSLPVYLRQRLAVMQHLLRPPQPVDPESLHLSLLFLGEQPLPALDLLHEELERLRHPAFDLALRGFGTFGKAAPTSVWADVVPEPALLALQAKVARAAVQAGIPAEARKFRPHVTLARFAPLPPEEARRLEAALITEAGFRSEPVRVERFSLFRSHLQRGGAVYEVLADYDLAG